MGNTAVIPMGEVLWWGKARDTVGLLLETCGTTKDFPREAAGSHGNRLRMPRYPVGASMMGALGSLRDPTGAPRPAIAKKHDTFCASLK